MSPLHKASLYILLLTLGFSLLVPGVLNVLRSETGSHWITASDNSALNQLRAFNAMMAAVGLLALWSCTDLENARLGVLWLGVILTFSALARLYSITFDGWPNSKTLLYLLVESIMALVFMLWPPP